ncbi:hypothetical protein CIHG_02632 [Coccidioides immitis H538.4]|uniref:CN hydrolase domain-containing protein n=1 Tax=Coccidioides immitis H538.4 TaxID=396776 RepID=A0A0J8UCA2_COCIT|nr:hypothetical protein CIHG_02632 [Coccidioides immitis H538.4]
MRIATLQFSPRLRDVDGNIERGEEILNKWEQSHGDEARKLDLLVLPEMAFTGYNFSSLETIKPYLEPTRSGPTAKWARSTARRLGCVVCVGYPEVPLLIKLGPDVGAKSPPETEDSNLWNQRNS